MRAISSSPDSPGVSSRVTAATRWAATHLIELRWPYRPAVLDVAWVVFSVFNLIAIFWFANWETIPFHFIWISLTMLYGFRTWRAVPTMLVLGAVMVTTASGIGLDVWRGSEPPEELTEVPLMAAVFIAMAWHAHRKQAAENSNRLISEDNARLLANQRQFLQDAAHQLRTPITIALGHAELLANGLTGQQQEEQDIQVVVGELNRLRRISERLLVIAAAADPEFLHLEPVALDRMTMDVIRRWRPTADRRWQLGRLDQVTAQADPERLALAIDALLENAVRHTATNDVIELSVVRERRGMSAHVIVADSGDGISADELHLIFDRFRIGGGQPMGTGLGLPLVRAVARAHGGDVSVRSRVGEGSQFELSLPEFASYNRGLPTVADVIAAGPTVPHGPTASSSVALQASARAGLKEEVLGDKTGRLENLEKQ